MKGVGTPQFASTGALKFSGYDWDVHIISNHKRGTKPLKRMDRYEQGAPHADQEEIGQAVVAEIFLNHSLGYARLTRAYLTLSPS